MVDRCFLFVRDWNFNHDMNSSGASKQQLCDMWDPHLPFCLKNPSQNMTPAPHMFWQRDQLSSLHFVPENHGIQHLGAISGIKQFESLAINPKADPTGRTGKKTMKPLGKKHIYFESFEYVLVVYPQLSSFILPSWLAHIPIKISPYRCV